MATKKVVEAVSDQEAQRTIQVLMVDSAKVLPVKGYMLLDDLASLVGGSSSGLRTQLSRQNVHVVRIGRKYLVDLGDMYEKVSSSFRRSKTKSE